MLLTRQMKTRKSLFNYLYVALCAGLLFGACSKDDDQTPPEEPKEAFTIINEYTKQDTNGVVYVTNYPIDQTAVLDDAAQSLSGYTYFDFNTNQFVPIDQVISPTAWDIAFKGKDGGDIYFNGFGMNNNFYENPPNGDVRVAYLRGDFDELTEVPEESAFTHRYYILRNDEAYASQYFQTWAITEGTATEVTNAIPIENNLYVFKLTDGRYVKFKMISNYKGGTTEPTEDDYKNNQGYLTFKYYVSEEGSIDLTTKK